MTSKIIIPDFILRRLYLYKNLSTHKIAKRFNCDPGVIQRRLKEYKIKLRYPKEKIIIKKNKLKRLYITQNLSIYKIARLLGISSCCVYYKLKSFGIKTRPKKIVNISKERIRNLYINKNFSCSKIAKIFNCNKISIFKKLKKYGIKTRNLSSANTIYPKKKFNGSNKLKAYMIGFRLGDLNVKAKNENWTIMVKSNTTRKEQFELVKAVYGRYGHFRSTFKNGVYGLYCNLDHSFNFLLKKEDKIDDWILEEGKFFFSFLGGYCDAEGSFGVYGGAARFRLGSYDKNLLKQSAEKLNSLGIRNTFNLESMAGTNNQNQDFYRINIMQKESLLKFITSIKPYIRHAKRHKDMILCENNILERNKKYKNKV